MTFTLQSGDVLCFAHNTERIAALEALGFDCDEESYQGSSFQVVRGNPTIEFNTLEELAVFSSSHGPIVLRCNESSKLITVYDDSIE